MAEDKITDTIVCANLDCKVATTGKCVEGLETAKCPHYGQVAADGSPTLTGAPASEAAEGVRLRDAETLTTSGVAKLLRAGDARAVAIIGPSDSGKTSLIASLYDLFQEGPVAGVEYARSLSLHAFEHACHDARAASRRNVPHINRTPFGEVRFYHLHVGGGSAGEGLALVLGDRAGEEYRAAADDVSVVQTFPEVKRADCLTLLVDGERLLYSGGRHNLRSEITMIMQSFVDSGVVRAGLRLALVLTKIDLVDGSPLRQRVDGDFAALSTNLERLFGSSFSRIGTFRIAASPKDSSVIRGTGVAELFAFWLEAASPTQTQTEPRPVFARAFAQLQPLAELEAEA